MAGREVEFEAALTVEEVAAFLEGLAKLLREGKGTLKAGRRSLVLRPTSTLLLEVEARTTAGKGWLELELEWQEPGGLVVAPGVEEEEDEDEWEEGDWEDEWGEEDSEEEDEEEVWEMDAEERTDANGEEEGGNGKA